MPVVVVDGDEPHRVGQPVRLGDGVDAGERRHDHRVGKRQRPPALEFDLAVADLLDRRVGQSLDVVTVKETLHHLLGGADAAEAEVAEERLGGDERDRSDLVQPGLLDPVAHVEQELVRGAEARPTLSGADDDRTGVLEEPLPRLAGEQRVVEVAHRLGVAAFGTEARDLLERQSRAGADEQPVVGDLLTGRRGHRTAGRVDLRRGLVDEPDALLRVHRRERERHVLGVTESEGKPDQRRDEGEIRPRVEHHDLVAISDELARLERRGHPREARTDDDDPLATGHVDCSFVGSKLLHNCTVVRTVESVTRHSRQLSTEQLCVCGRVSAWQPFLPRHTRFPSR